MKVLIKKVLFLVFNFLSSFIKVKKFENKDENILILLQKPLGLGDLVMLSPMISLIEKSLKNKIYIISEYNEFIEFDRLVWLKPSELDEDFLKNSIVISPTLTWSHLKYIFKAKYFIGYFLTNRLISNIKKVNYCYNPKNEHYLLKCLPIMDILGIKYNKSEFIYPLIKSEKLEVDSEDYIVIASYSNWKERQYPFDNYVQLINRLILKYKTNIILIGSNSIDEVEFNKKLEEKISNSLILNLCGKTSILQMNHLIKNSKLFIGNDSGPSNIAYISAKKSLVFFGSVFFENRLPINDKLTSNILALDSRASCKYFPCYDGYNKPICKNKDLYFCLSKSFIDDPTLDSFIGEL